MNTVMLELLETFVDIMKLYISALGHAIILLSINQMFQHHARVILCILGEVYILVHELYISALEHARMLI